VKNLRNSPIKIVCGATKYKVINQIIFEEYIRNRNGWAERAIERLKRYNISITAGTLSTYKRELIRGDRNPATISIYGGTSNSHFASRHGKDGMYSQFKLWCDIFVDTFQYVGLPANQILAISKDFGAEYVVACEKNKSTYNHMKNMQTYFSEPPYAIIKNKDIFKFLEETNMKFSIYDFDLMCHISEKIISKIIHSVNRTAMEKVVVNIATTIGRKITEEQYYNMVPNSILEACKKHELNVLKYHCGGYNDRIMPMRYVFLAIEKRSDNVL
jgi:hypothetical protein